MVKEPLKSSVKSTRRPNSSRRSFLRGAGLTASALLLAKMPELCGDRSWIRKAQAAGPDSVLDTINGLIAFVLPGSDSYSVGQGLSSSSPGGIDAGIAGYLIEDLDGSVSVPQFSAVFAGALNTVAGAVQPGAAFAGLSYMGKVQVFAYIDSDPQLAPLAGMLALVAYLCYSEAAVFNPSTRTLDARPLGYQLSSYEGVADGRAEFLGYYQGRKRVVG